MSLPLQSLLKFTLPAVVILYLAVALGVHWRWNSEGWNQTTGDEPHYLQYSRSLYLYGSLNPARAGEEQFALTHTHVGPHGIVSFHYPGVPTVVAIPIAFARLVNINEVLLVRRALIVLSAVSVIAVWQLARLNLRNPLSQALAVAVVCISVPVVIGASQILPDLIAGMLLLVGLAWIALRLRSPTPPPLWADLAVSLALACTPWLHIKYGIPAGVVFLGLAYVVYSETRSLQRPAVVLGVAAASACLLTAHNLYIWGGILGLPGDAATMELNDRTLMRFIGLHIDRWHGIVLLDPVMLIGFAFLVPFIAKQPKLGITCLLCYIAALLPNAAQSSSYGATGFAARYAWAAYLVFVPAVMYGLGRIEALSSRALWSLLALLLALQVLLILPLALTYHNLYNRGAGTWFSNYPSFYPHDVWRFLPMLYNINWAFSYPTNYVYLVLVIGAVGVGLLTLRARALVAPAVAGLLVFALVAIPVAASLNPEPPRSPMIFNVAQLSSNIGTAQGNGVRATVGVDRPGRFTLGPSVILQEGDYEATLIYRSPAMEQQAVGSWDVVAGPHGARRVSSITRSDLKGTNAAASEAKLRFRVTSKLSGQRVQVRTNFDGVADLDVLQLVIRSAD